MQERDDGYAIRVGLLAVIAFMSWPVWLAIVSGQRSFTTGVALSALVFGARHVDGVEINPIIADIVMRDRFLTPTAMRK